MNNIFSELDILIDKYPSWNYIREGYLSKLYTNKETDFNACIDLCKSMIEAICREICKQGKIEANENMRKLVVQVIQSYNFKYTEEVRSFFSGFISIINNVSDLRNSYGLISHGRNHDDYIEKKNIDNSLLYSTLKATESISILLIELFEKHGVKIQEKKIYYDQNEDFNFYFDNINDIDIIIGECQYRPSEVLFHTDHILYLDEMKKYEELINYESDD